MAVVFLNIVLGKYFGLYRLSRYRILVLVKSLVCNEISYNFNIYGFSLSLSLTVLSQKNVKLNVISEIVHFRFTSLSSFCYIG